MPAFAPLNSQGIPVNVANAAPTLTTLQLLKDVAVTAAAPSKTSDPLYIESAAAYGVPANNSLSGSISFTATAACKLAVQVDGNIQREFSLEAGRQTINFDDDVLDIIVGFGSKLEFVVTYIAADATISALVLNIFQQ